MILIGIGVLLVATLVTAFVFRQQVLIFVLSKKEFAPLSDPNDEGAGVEWYDDYFTVQRLADNTYAIGEPRYSQQNFNYLFVGSHRAVLFDSGPGVRDIKPVVKSLTDKPVTLAISHLHYDHTGNADKFSNVALIDLPHLRKQATNGELKLTWKQHLGALEGIATPTLHVSDWYKPDSVIDLGGRSLNVIYTPGHTDDSMSFFDIENNMIFTGDFFYEGFLLGIMPNSNMADYEHAIETVLSMVKDNIRIYGAHRGSPKQGAPEQSIKDLEDLKNTLRDIREGTKDSKGFIYPAIYKINKNLTFIAESRWTQNWEQTYPVSN